MVGWYNIRQLTYTGIRSVISGMFGNYTDRREIQAALDLVAEQQNQLETAPAEIWVDYIADLGDGFNATYTMADLLAQDTIQVDTAGYTHTLPKASIIVMGGDEVYPTPSLDEYNRRTKCLYEAAFPAQKDGKEVEKTYLYAIPGNHDWYDGLGTFLKLFTQKRRWGSLQTRQSRSYFAVKLTEDVWLWGIDVQLNSDIDQPQLMYFQALYTSQKMVPGNKVILCTAEPSWVYHTHHLTDQSYERLTYFQRKCIEEPGFELIVMLTGDLHHYSHYCGTRDNGKTVRPIHTVTSGGGGAFLHPTHFLKQKLNGLEANGIREEMTLQTCFPSATESHVLSFRNFLFPFLNPSFGMALGSFFLLIIWLLQSSVPPGSQSLISHLSRTTDVEVFLIHTANFLQHSPMAIVMALLMGMGFVQFADNQTGEKGRKNYFKLLGAFHGLVQVVGLFFFLWAVSWFNFHLLEKDVTQIERSFIDRDSFILLGLLIVEIVGIGGFLGGFLMGCYLFCCIYFFHIHYNEAFSSFRYEGFKHFLRIHVTPAEVIIYPIGVRKITTDWQMVSQKEEGGLRFRGRTASCELIEKPIRIALTRVSPPVMAESPAQKLF